MDNDESALLDELQAAADDFLSILELNEGPSELFRARLCDLILECGNVWTGKLPIPKKAALIFSELYPAIVRYSPFADETRRQEIESAAALILECILISLDPRGPRLSSGPTRQ